jgi:gliding motility-associated-like protein
MIKFRLFGLLVLSTLLCFTASAKNPKPTMPPISVFMEDRDMECGKSSPISIKVKDFKNVTNFQFSVNFPTTRMKGDSVVKFNPAFPDDAYNVLTLPNGDVTFSWTGNAVSLPDNAVLFTIYITPYYYGLNPPTPGTALIKFSDSPTPIQSYTTASVSVTYPVVTDDANITIIDKTPPTALCPNSQFYKGLDSVLVANITGVAIDDCGSAKITSHKMTGANNLTGLGDANGKYYKLGVTKVVYTATDLAGNTAQCPFKIILVKPSDDTITIFANSKLSRCELPGIVEYPVFIANAQSKDLTKMNFSLEWSKGNFDFVAVTGINPAISGVTFNNSAVTNGQLGVSWSGATFNPADNTRLFNLRLKPKGLASQTAVSIMSTPTPISVASAVVPSYPVRIEAGELFIVDELKPEIKCKDTIIYTPTASGPHTMKLSEIYPTIDENCLIDKNTYKYTGVTTANGNYNGATNISFNYGVTNAEYFVSDYGFNKDTCFSKIQVNRLRFDLNKDSIPCSITSKTLDLRVTDFERLKSFKYTLSWNPTMLALNPNNIVLPNAVVKNNLAITGNVTSGSLTFTWTLPSGSLDINDNDILMSFPFQLLGNVNSPVSINWQGATMINSTSNIVAQITNGSIKNYDTQKPTITNCPTDITDVISTAGVCTKKITWTAPTLTDDCFSVKNSDIKIYKELGTTFPPNTPTFSGDDFGIGQNIIRYVVSDVFGNSTSCSFKINISENVAPQIVGCVPNITQNTDAGKPTAKVTWNNPTVNESCGIASEVFSKAKNSDFKVGVTTVIYTVTDKSGNSAACNFTVTVKDAEKPVFDNTNFPTNVTVPNRIDSCGAFVTWNTPTATDNHTAAKDIKITSSHQSGDYFKVGTTTVTYTAIDSTGNIGTRTFDVTVIDAQAPKFVSCPAQLTVNLAGAACNSPYTPPVLQTKDNCIGLVNVTASNIPAGNNFPLGKTTLIYVDPNNANVKCNLELTIQVSAKPNFTNVNDITVTTLQGECNGEVPTATEPKATDACGSNNVTITKSPNLTKYPAGTTVVTYTATDAYGNTNTTSIKVVIVNSNPPSISNCPKDITATADLGKDSKVISWIPPTATAFCGNIVSLTPDKQPNTAFPIGTTTVTYTATDNTNNTVTCTFTVKVIDTQAPTIDCPPTGEINVDANPNDCGKTIPLPDIKDNSGKTPTIVSSTGIPANNFYPVGKTVVNFTVSDEAGNTAACSYTVTVKDVTKPTFTNVKDVTISAGANDCTAKLSPADSPTASDGCGNTTLDIKGNIDIDKLPMGTSTVILVATDPDGNKATATFKVTVVDNVAPTFANCPQKIVVSTDAGKDFATVPWTPPTATDNCSVVVSSNKKPNDQFPIGTTQVVYTATDPSNNKTTCVFDVEVQDKEKPTIDCKDITINSKVGECGATLVALPQVTDNVKLQGNPIYNPSLPTNNYFPVGEQTFTISAQDAAGNLANCTLKVIVKDNEKPTLTACPTDITIDAKQGDCTAALTALPKPTFTDNCGANDVVITSNRDSIAQPLVFKTGETTKVIHYGKDKQGNVATCVYNVMVTGDIRPVLTCPKDIMAQISATKCDTTISWQPASAVPGCQPLVGTVQSDIQSGATFKSGNTVVTYKIKDQSGLEGACSFNVFVKEPNTPTFLTGSFPKDIELPASDATCDATHTWVVPTASDNCTGAADLKVEHVSGPKPNDKLVVGKYVVTYRVTDKSLNTQEASFTITVTDKTAPKFTICPKDVTVDMFGNIISDPDKYIATVSKSADCKEVAIAFKTLTADDKCSAPLKIDVSQQITNFPIGTPTTLTYTATDAAGNTATCAFKVNVETFVAPKVSVTNMTNPNSAAMPCPGSEILLKADSVAGVTYTWTGPNGFTSNDRIVSIKNADYKNVGEYVLNATQNACVSSTPSKIKVDLMASPRGKEDNYKMFMGDILTENVLPNDTLIAGEETLIKVVENTANGKLNLRNDGIFDYEPLPTYFGNDQFKYNVCYETCPTACSGPVLAKIKIDVKEVKVPNVISPNDDGQNDILVIDYPFNGKEKPELYVFNEWGHLLYTANPYTPALAWKGTHNDKPVPDGTYYWVFKIDTDAKPIKGFVTVLR